MTRLKQQPERQLIARIKSIQEALVQLKTDQSVGSASIEMNKVESSNTYDIKAAPPLTIGGLTVWQIEWVPANTNFNKLNLCYELYTQLVAYSGNSPYWVMQRMLPSGNNQLFQLAVINNSSSYTNWAEFKLTFYVLGSGSFSVTKLI